MNSFIQFWHLIISNLEDIKLVFITGNNFHFHLELLKLLSFAEHGQYLPLVHDVPHQLIEGLHGVVLDVVVAGGSAQVHRGHDPVTLIIPDHPRLVQTPGSIVDHCSPLADQSRVLPQLLVLDTIHLNNEYLVSTNQ